MSDCLALPPLHLEPSVDSALRVARVCSIVQCRYQKTKVFFAERRRPDTVKAPRSPRSYPLPQPGRGTLRLDSTAPLTYKPCALSWLAPSHQQPPPSSSTSEAASPVCSFDLRGQCSLARRDHVSLSEDCARWSPFVQVGQACSQPCTWPRRANWCRPGRLCPRFACVFDPLRAADPSLARPYPARTRRLANGGRPTGEGHLPSW